MCRRSTSASLVGDFAPIRDWLGEHVHRVGRRLDPREILRRATGEPLRPEPFLEYLETKLLDAGMLTAPVARSPVLANIGSNSVRRLP